MTKTERAKIVAAFASSARIRITRNGEVHCYGAPHTTSPRTGWYFAAFVDDVLDRLEQEAQDRAWFAQVNRRPT